jgi:hypothetical protein
MVANGSIAHNDEMLTILTDLAVDEKDIANMLDNHMDAVTLRSIDLRSSSIDPFANNVVGPSGSTLPALLNSQQ